MRVIRGTLFCGFVCLLSVPASAGSVTAFYTALSEGTSIDLTAQGTLSWVKFGNGENPIPITPPPTFIFQNTTKTFQSEFLPTFADDIHGLGSALPGSVVLFGVTGGGLLNFTWTDGNFAMYNDPGPVDTVVTETVDPSVDSYPIGLGAAFGVAAVAGSRSLDVYVQGFDSNMRITATLTDGTSSFVDVGPPTLAPTSDPKNFYSIGDFHVDYSGAGQMLTISVQTEDNPDGTSSRVGDQSAFANAGFFAATLSGAPAPAPVPEPASLTVWGVAVAGMLAFGWRKRKQVA